MELKIGLAADYRLLEREEKEEKIKIVKFLDGAKATVVTNCGKVKEIQTELLELAQHSWFYSRLSRPFAEQMLKQKDRPINRLYFKKGETQ